MIFRETLRELLKPECSLTNWTPSQQPVKQESQEVWLDITKIPCSIDLSSLVPDYTVSESDLVDVKKITLTQEEILSKHPAEYVTPLIRKNLDYLSQIQKNEFLLFNLPRSITKEKILEVCTVKGVQVIRSALT